MCRSPRAPAPTKRKVRMLQWLLPASSSSLYNLLNSRRELIRISTKEIFQADFVKQTNKKVHSSLLIVVKMTNIRQWHLLTCIPGSVGFPFLSVTSELPFWLSSPVYYLMHSLAFLHGQCQLASDCRYATKDSHSALLANTTKHYVSGHFFWVLPFL